MTEDKKINLFRLLQMTLFPSQLSMFRRKQMQVDTVTCGAQHREFKPISQVQQHPVTVWSVKWGLHTRGTL